MNGRNLIIPVLLALLLAASGAAFYFYERANNLQSSAGASQKIAKPDVAALVARVGKLTLLPEGEIPTVATVSNPEKLKDQAFFVNAKVGDKVLVYTGAKKVYLYDPTENLLINVAPLNIDASSSTRTIP